MLSLDLHGVRHADVSGEVDRFLSANLSAHSKEVTIVTGNSEKMKAEVRRVLAEYNLQGVEGFFNKGELRVDLT